MMAVENTIHNVTTAVNELVSDIVLDGLDLETAKDLEPELDVAVARLNDIRDQVRHARRNEARRQAHLRTLKRRTT